MSRNLCAEDCVYCGTEPVVDLSGWKFATKEMCGPYTDEFRDLGYSFAYASCPWCVAQYIALDRGHGVIEYLSHRSTFNDEPGEFDGPKNGIVSSVRLEEGVGHDIVHVWNQGAKAGELTVKKGAWNSHRT